jgi:myo-inositol 2-dehydrogenase/D-chiro-inositol 1-dehydrogenase
MMVAVIGAGRMGALHAHALVGLPAVEEVAVADLDQARADALAGECGCVATDGIDSVWKLRPAGVVIASSSRAHAGLVRRALDAKVGVLCEKPLTPSLEESFEIADRARRTGVPVIVGFHRRFDSSFLALREQVRRGEFGESFLLHVRHSDTAPPPPGYLGTAPGTMFVDMCIHDYDAIRWLAGDEVQAVSSVGARLTGLAEFELHNDVDTVVSTLHLATGGVAVLEAFRQSPYGYQAHAEVIARDAQGGTFPRRRTGAWFERFADAFRAEIKGFVGALAGEETEGATARDATMALQIALAAERSFAERRTISVGEIR